MRKGVQELQGDAASDWAAVALCPSDIIVPGQLGGFENQQMHKYINMSASFDQICV